MKKLIRKILGLEKKPDVSYLQYIENKGTILRPGFSLRVDDPEAGKIYLELGTNSYNACNIIFESKEGKVTIGDNNAFGHSSIICRKEIVFEDYIHVGWGCTFVDHSSHSLDYLERRKDTFQVLENIRSFKNVNHNKNWDVVDAAPIKVCSDVWIGMNCMILKGVTIGEGAIVAANSVVTKDVAPFTLVGGNPAKVIRALASN